MDANLISVCAKVFAFRDQRRVMQKSFRRSALTPEFGSSSFRLPWPVVGTTNYKLGSGLILRFDWMPGGREPEDALRNYRTEQFGDESPERCRQV